MNLGARSGALKTITSSFLKKITLFIAFLIVFSASFSQTTIVGWDFEDSDNIADSGIPCNSAKTIYTEERSMTGASYVNTGTGANGLAAQLVGWDQGNGIKYWVIEFDATGYENLIFSSKQSSNNNGPEFFAAEYSANGISWAAIQGGSVQISSANDWTVGTLSNVALPASLDNQSSIFIRWIMTSNERVNGSGNVNRGGRSRIDEVIVQGDFIPPSEVTVSSTGTPDAGSFISESVDNQLYGISMEVNGRDAELTGIRVTTNGSYLASDIGSNGFKLWYSSDAAFDSGSDTQLQAIDAVSSGNDLVFSGFTQSIAAGSTAYIFLSVDVAVPGANNRTISIDAPALSNFSYNPPVATSGSATDGNVQTIKLALSVFTFTGAAGNELTFIPDVQPPHASVSDISRGTSILASGLSNAFNSSSWPISGIDNNSYYEITITAENGHNIDVHGIQLDHSSTSDGPSNWEIRSSLDSYTSNIGGIFSSTTDGNWNQATEVNFGSSISGQSTVTIRIYAYSATEEAGTWGVDNIYILGRTNDVQVPSFTTGYPKADSSRNDGFHLYVNVDEPATAYYKILANPSVPPTAVEVLVNPAGSIVATSANLTYSTIITGLSPEAGYDVYFVLDDGTNQSGMNQSLKNIRTSDLDGTIVEPSSQVQKGTISSIADTPEEAVDVFSFALSDDGDADNSPTIVTGIQIAQAGVADLRNVVAGVTLKNSSNNQISIASQTINANSIHISLDPGQLVVSNGNSEEVTLGIYLQSSGLVDNQSIRFIISAAQQFTTSDYFTQFATPATPNIIIGELQTINVSATKLAVNSHSTQAQVNRDIDLEVYATDINGNLDIDESSSVTVTLGYNMQGGTLSLRNPPPNFTESLVNGIVTWDNIRYNSSDIITLILTSATFTDDTTGTIVIGNPSDLIVNSDLTVSNNLAGIRDVIINDGATLTLAEGVVLGLERNFTFNGTGTLNDLGATTLFNSGNRTVQVISKSSATASEQFYNIEVDIGNRSIVRNEIALDLLNTLTMTDGTIDVDGSANDKGFTLVSTSSNTARIGPMTDGTEISGEIVWQRSLRTGPANWRYIGTPIKGQTLRSISDDIWIQGIAERYPNAWTNIAMYNEPSGTEAQGGSDGWVSFSSNSNSIGNGMGMKLWLWASDYVTEQKISMKGAPVIGNGQDGIAGRGEIFVFPTPSYTPSALGGGGWNFYANPYPSEIDWELVTTINLSGGSVYVWNPSIQAYGSYNPFTNQGTNGVTRYIASGQGFFIKANGPVASLQMTEASKSDQSGNTFLRIAEGTMPKLVVKATSANGKTDETAIVFTDFASDDYDPEYDTEKLATGWVNLSSTVQNGKKLDINAMGNKHGAQVVVLNIDPYQFGNYTLTFPLLESFGDSDILRLVDNYLHKSMVITPSSSYSFSMQKENKNTFGGDRFEIQFIEPVRLRLENNEVRAGQEFLVPIYAEQLETINSIQLGIEWDNDALSFIEIESTNSSHSIDIDLSKKEEGRLVLKDAFNSPTDFPDEVKLFSVKFKALNGNLMASLKFEKPQIKIVGGNDIELPFETKDANISILQYKQISGTVSTYTGIGINEVKVYAEGEYSIEGTTENNGKYLLDAFENERYILSLSKPDDIKLNTGITTVDIIKARRHLLNVEKFESPYQIIAADINRSKSMSALDLHLMKLAVLGDENGFKDRINWLFIPDKYDLENNPFVYETEYEVNQESEIAELDFIAIKIGDVNNSWKAPTSGRRAERNIELDLQNSRLDDSFIEIPVTVRDFDDISGYQFSISWDAAEIEFYEVKNDAVEGLFNEQFVNEGFLTTAWDEISGQSIGLENGSSLFTLRFRAKNGSAKSTVEINSDLIEAIAFDSKLNALGIKASSVQVHLEELRNGQLELGQNVPNPFSLETNIEFKIAKPGIAKLTILNTLGEVVFIHKQEYNPGYYQINWNKSQGLKSIPRGVYIYKLESNGEEVVRKMLTE